KVVFALGDLVQDWVNINAPNASLEGTYRAGKFPPNKPNFFNVFEAARYAVRAPIRAYESSQEIRRDKNHPRTTMVRADHHLRVFDIDHKSPGGILPASMMDHVFHNIVLEGMVHGKFIFPIGNGGYPLGKGPYCDFMGVNYYSRDIIRFSYNPLR